MKKNKFKNIGVLCAFLTIGIYNAQHNEIPQRNEEHHNNQEYKKSDSFIQKIFKVEGSCEMCKARIEKTALNAGAKSALWNAETQTLNLEISEEKTSFDEILKQIAQVGHDNEAYKAPDEVYHKLPGCCHYRDGESSSNHGKNHPHSENNHHEAQIKEVNIIAEKKATSISKNETSLLFNITKKELSKAACCNLSESFETNATVDVAINNAVTGSKQLKMLGLDQKYTAITKELLPEIRGLAAAHGLNFIPGRWISGIQLTKGGSSVVNGYESITGHINTELVKAEKTPKTSLNFFYDTDNRQEINIVHSNSINEQWKQSIFLHQNATLSKSDHNNDNFLDRPTGYQLNTAYLLEYSKLDPHGWASQTGINFLLDKRNAGQMDFDTKQNPLLQSFYGVEIDQKHLQIWNKIGHIFKNRPYQSIGLMNKFTAHQQNSFFGQRTYNGDQKTFYSNLVFESIFGDTNHKYKAGASFLYDSYNEQINNLNYQRTESVPGIFFEYQNTGSRYTLVAGVRADFHNLAGTHLLPRLNFKYDLTPKTILRISAGKGIKTANIFAENQQFLTSNRSIHILNNNGKIYGLKPEIAWNYGASIQQEFKIFERKSTFLLDFFRTDFINQVITDLDQSTHQILFYNLDGKSFANSLQAEWDFQPVRNLDIRLAYKYQSVYTDFISGKKQAPFIPKNRFFTNLSYATKKNEKGGFWAFDTTLNWVGTQRLPSTENNPLEFQIPSISDPYFTLNAQISKTFNAKSRVYLGLENITNTIQKNAIIQANNPFGNYFDAGLIYAPTMKRLIYIGVDFDI